MKAESIVFAVAGMCFGVILGWVIAAQHDGPRSAAAPPAQTATVPQGAGAPRQPRPLDEARVRALMTILESDPKNAGAAVQLANTYHDAERWTDAIKWYEQALDADPNNADASTDLGVSYYYTGQTDRALAQFAHSLRIDPRHTKTMLNQGIVLAFGKQDLGGATAAWKKVVELAPDSPEGRAAQRALEGVASAAHSGVATTPGS